MNFSKHFFAFCCSSMFTVAAFAQVDVTASGGTANASYSTLGAAFTAINSGTHTGTITIGISASTTESASAVLNASGSGAASYASIAISPTGGAAQTITGSVAGDLIDLNGADNVTIDGLNSGGNSLTISNSHVGATSSAIRFINDASSNIVTKCTITSSETSASYGTIVFSTSGGGNGNDNNSITYCTFAETGSNFPAVAIYCNGTTTSGQENSGVNISYCNVSNFFSASVVSSGILVSAGGTGWYMSDNKFYQTATRTYTTANTHSVINLATGNGHTISSNTIGYATSSYTGTYTMTSTVAHRFVAINLAVGTTTATSVQSNYIQAISMTTSSGATTTNGVLCVMNITAGNVNVGTVVGNTIGNAFTGSISATVSTSGGSINIINCSSTGTVNISGNAIGSVTNNGSSTSISASVIGMVLSGAGTLTISGNTIGHASTGSSINANTSSTSATAQVVTGISSSASGTLSITNNTIANLNNNYAGTATAGQVRGIVSSSAGNTITGNTIRNLSTTSGNAGTGASASVTGISFTSTSSSSQTISQNIVHSLSNTHATAAVCVTGIYMTGPTSGTHVVSRNFVHSLSIASSSTSCIMAGIQINGGTGITYQNNMVRLGIDAAGSSITTGFSVYGIYQTLGSTIYIYHNSVYIGGSGVSSVSNTAAFYRTQTASAATILNNVFVNARSNTSGTGVNRAFHISATSDYTNPYLTVNNNIYRAPGTGGVLAAVSSTDYSTLSAWQTTTAFDAASGVGDPGFSNATGNASAADLHVSGTTPVEGTGSSSTGVTDDYDGSTRSGLTAVDIGADAGNFTASDIFTPTISYTALSANTASTSNRTLNNVTISDIGTAVPTTGGSRPRIWFRRSAPSTSSWASAAGTLGSGNGNSGTWSFTIDYSLLSITPTSGETYEYYIVAQDQATTPNLGYSPSAGASHTDVSTQTSPPTTPNSYSIVTGLSTTITVGTSQTYTSLTGASGLFAAINGSALTGNTTVNITSDLSEDGNTALMSSGLAGYTLTIQPSAASMRVISNSTTLAVSMIRLSGVTGVTIDGNSGGSGQYLRIVNTHTTAGSCQPAVEVSGSSSSTIIRNCIIETNATTTSLGNVFIGTGTNTAITISGNDIRDAQGTPGTAGIPANLIYSNTGTNVVTVQNNNIFNFTNYGIGLSSVGDACTVSGNSVYYNAGTTPSTAQVGIIIGAGNNHTISGNYIGGQSATCGGSAWTNSGTITFTGIQINAGSVTASSVQNNTVQNISLTGTAGVSFNGILVSGGAVNIGTGTGNLVGHASTANSISNTGSTASGTSVTIGINITSTGTTTVSNNTIANITSSSSTATTSVGVRGISNTGSGQCTISGNTVTALSANAATSGTNGQAAPVGIFTNSANTGQLITNNTISNLSNTNTTAVAAGVLGIATNSSSGAGTISRNRILGLSTAATGTSPMGCGIYFNAASAWTVANNQVTVTNGSNTNAAVITGIRDGSAGTNNYYYNSVYVAGSASSGAYNSYGFLRTSTATVVLRNNLLYNERSGGTGAHYAIGNTAGTPATGWSSTASNYNLFVVPGLSAMGEWGSGTAQTLAQWQTSSGGDASSLVELNSNVSSNNLFMSATGGNLNIFTSATACWYANGRGTQVSGQTEDYASASAGRSVTVAGGGTDIGSDEFTPGVNPPDVTVSGSHTTSGTETFTFAGRTVATITWGASGTLPTLGSYKYWPGTNPNDITNNGGVSGATYTNAYWVINVTGGSGYTYDLTLYYDDALLGSIASEANLKIAKKQTGVAGTWGMYASTVNTTNNTLSTTGLTSFSEFTGSENATPLPVELLSFTGQTLFDNVQLNWSTASEHNNKQFEVEVSADMKDFETAGIVKGKGNSSTVNNYSFTHMTAFGSNTTLYYRLRQVDHNGDYTHSQVISVRKSQNKNITIETITPNPFTAQLSITLGNLSEGNLQVEVLDMGGKQLYTHTQATGTGTQHIDLSQLNTLPEGIYMLSVSNGSNNIRQKLVKLR